MLHNAQVHFKVVFGLSATHPRVTYLDTFSFGGYVAHRKELSLSPAREKQAFAALEHCGTYLAAVQVHSALESIYPGPFHIPESEIAAAFQIARLLRNAFAHNPLGPVWEIRDAWKNQIFDVPGAIRLDTSGVDGQAMKRKHYGGPLAILGLLGYAESIVDLRARQQITQLHCM